MARDPKATVVALHRFGFGPRKGLVDSIAADPRGALIEDLDRPGAGQIASADLLTSSAASRAVFEYRAERNANRRRGQDRGQEGQSAEAEAMPLPRRLFLAEAKVRV